MNDGVRVNEISRRIMHAYMLRLHDEDNELLQDPAVPTQLRHQVQAIVKDVALGVGLSIIDAATEVVTDVVTDVVDSADIGVRRAARGVHPFESLHAASALFEVGMSVLAELLPPGDPASVNALSLALHDAIMRRVAVASISYVDVLRAKLQASRQEERRRIARELHDRVGHEIAVVLQHLELHRHQFHRSAPADATKDHMDGAVISLQDALRTVQQMSTELRHSLDSDGIEADLRTYISLAVPPSITSTVTVSLAARKLPRDMSEEVFLILREAIRNAVRHADPTALVVEMDTNDRVLRASVRDDGCGFAPETVIDLSHIGLSAMAERADLLDGVLEIDSGPGRGTTVTLRAPWHRAGLS